MPLFDNIQRRILIQILENVIQMKTILSCLEHKLSDLDVEVADLKSAVTDLASRFPTDDLAQKLADALAKIDALQVEDDAAKAEVADLVADAQENVAEIANTVTQIRALGAPSDGAPENTGSAADGS